MAAPKIPVTFEIDSRDVARRERSAPPHSQLRDGVTIVRVKGALRTPVASELRQPLETVIHRGGRRVLLDLAALSDIDAAGVGELVRAFTALRAAGGVLQVAGANGYVRRVLDVAGVSTVLKQGVEAA